MNPTMAARASAPGPPLYVICIEEQHMPELTAAMKEITGFTAITVVFLIAGAVLIESNRTVDRSARNVFLVSIIMLLFITIVDWFTYLTNGQYPELRGIHTAAMAITFAVAPAIPVAIANVIFPDANVRWVMIVLVAQAVFQFVGIFGGFVFYVDESNTYHRGPLYIVYMAVYTLASVYLVVESVRAGRTYQSASFAAVIVILICLAVGVLIQVFDGQMRTTWPTVAMTVILYFQFYSDMILRSDPLTKLLNRRSYEEFLAKPTFPCVFVAIDVDDFKHANDTYGHAFGDFCLSRIAGMIRKVFGSAGLCYRSGGDEFVVIMTKRLTEVDALADEMMASTARARDEEPRLPGVSIGYAVAEAGCTDIAMVIDEADRAMYETKRDHKAGER